MAMNVYIYICVCVCVCVSTRVPTAVATSNASIHIGYIVLHTSTHCHIQQHIATYINTLPHTYVADSHLLSPCNLQAICYYAVLTTRNTHVCYYHYPPPLHPSPYVTLHCLLSTFMTY